MKKSEINIHPIMIKTKSLLRLRAEYNRQVKKEYKINQYNTDEFHNEIFNKMTETDGFMYEICTTYTKDKCPYTFSLEDEDIVWGSLDD